MQCVGLADFAGFHNLRELHVTRSKVKQGLCQVNIFSFNGTVKQVHVQLNVFTLSGEYVLSFKGTVKQFQFHVFSFKGIVR